MEMFTKVQHHKK